MKTNAKWVWLPLIVFAVLVVVLAVGLMTRQQERPSARIAATFPAFSLPQLNDPQHLQGSDALRGHVTLVNVWGSWCPSCEEEVPALLQLQHEGVRILGVAYRDERADAQGFLARHGNPYADSIMDPEGTLSFDLGVYGAPETFIVDARGVIRYHHAGVLTATLIDQQIRPLLKELASET